MTAGRETTPPTKLPASDHANGVHLVARIDEGAARRRIERTFWRRPAAARLERIAWPHFVVQFGWTNDGSDDADATAQRRAPSAVTVYVDGRDPTCTAMTLQPWLAGPVEPAALVLPNVDAAAALRAAERALGQGLLAAARWRAVPDRRLIAPPRLVFWPLWAYYHRRRSGILDVLLWDAVRDGRCGPKTKAALLAALVESTIENRAV